MEKIQVGHISKTLSEHTHFKLHFFIVNSAAVLFFSRRNIGLRNGCLVLNNNNNHHHHLAISNSTLSIHVKSLKKGKKKPFHFWHFGYMVHVCIDQSTHSVTWWGVPRHLADIWCGWRCYSLIGYWIWFVILSLRWLETCNSNKEAIKITGLTWMFWTQWYGGIFDPLITTKCVSNLTDQVSDFL